jgi:hypothetical protein
MKHLGPSFVIGTSNTRRGPADNAFFPFWSDGRVKFRGANIGTLKKGMDIADHQDIANQ